MQNIFGRLFGQKMAHRATAGTGGWNAQIFDFYFFLNSDLK